MNIVTKNILIFIMVLATSGCAHQAYYPHAHHAPYHSGYTVIEKNYYRSPPRYYGGHFQSHHEYEHWHSQPRYYGREIYRGRRW